MWEERLSLGGDRLEGNVLSWKGRFGWIGPDTPVEHEEAWRHGGRIYAHADDTDAPLSVGARVSFLLYVDGKGLGAEKVWIANGDVLPRDAGVGRVIVRGHIAAHRGATVPPVVRKGGGAGDVRMKGAVMAPKGAVVAPKGAVVMVPGVMRPIEKPPCGGGSGGPKANGGFKAQEKGATAATGEGAPAAVVKGTPAAADEGKSNGASKGAGKGSKSCKGKSMPPMLLAALGQGPNREKSTTSGQDTTVLRWACSEMQGWRPAMEDATCAILDLPPPLGDVAMFGVFDGHGGAEVSRRVAAELPQVLHSCAMELLASGKVELGDAALLEQALTTALPTLDATLCEEGAAMGGPPGGHGLGPAGLHCDVDNAFALMGSTACVALIEMDASRRPRRVVVANCGDSRAALSREGEVVQLTEDHKPEAPAERERIEAAGGHVAKVGPCFRVDGWGLNMSRALGDFHYKARTDLAPEAQKVSSVPEVRTVELTTQDEFLLLGCDGVFELHDWKAAIDLPRAGLAAGKPLTEVVEDLCDASCSTNLLETQGSGGDNVSAMVVMLR